ncbi:alpha/beta hydrolase [Myxococcus sp. K38C18041901]|uniref:dienelactone hydrolase family protein n=1 Tax=Myxococcus guangdongensis TaxID=2906760 RepID=UPI0020A79243|nr:alpha/beta hydrolase [Myxococcus guangdongensis]MCP3062860.1 alpha/beta hydrolase [Myxococcus guangdongensis]
MSRLGVSVAVVLGLVLVGSGARAAGTAVLFEGVWRRPDGGLVRVAGEDSAPFLMDFASRRRWRLEPKEPGVWVLGGSRPEARVTWRPPKLVLAGLGAEPMVLEVVPVRTEAVTVPGEDTALPATLWLPPTGKPRTAVVLLHDVGQGSREALEPYPTLLVEHGLAVLTYDARGAGLKAQGDDGLAAVKLLRKRLGPSVRVGLMGFGQGAWAAVAAAARAPEEVGFLVLISGGAGAVWKQEQHRMRNEGRKRGLTGPELVDLNEFLDVLHDARLYAEGGEARARKTLDFHFQRAKRKRWLAVTPLSSLGDVTVERFLVHQRPLWRDVLSYDAAEDLPRVRGPVLALLGERDETTPAALTARALNQGLSKRAGEDNRTQVKVIEGADHALAVATRESPAVETMSRQALDTLSSWLRALEAQ